MNLWMKEKTWDKSNVTYKVTLYLEYHITD